MNNPVTQIKSNRLQVVEDALENLEQLCTLKLSSTETFNEACSAVSDDAWSKYHIRLDAAVIRSYVTARVRDRMEKYNERAEQMNLLMDDIG